MKRFVFLLLPLLALSEVVKDFDTCNKFFLNNKPPTFTPKGVSVQRICQCVWNDDKKPIYLYATLYSTTWKIPIYSAYVFGSPNLGRCDAWYIEPQLDGINKPKCMQPKGLDAYIGTNQAVNRDYERSGYNRGHLYPVLHTDSHVSMLATSTLTNAAPQNPAFNQGPWLRHEEAVIKDLKACTKAYVVTGVVPDTNIKINNKITVSKYYWRATCCVKSGQHIMKGYLGPDNNGKVQNLTIEELQEKLKVFYKVPITIFPAKPQKRPRE